MEREKGKEKQESINNLDLRSERVRNIIGEIPPGLVRYGTMLIMFILVALFLAAYYIPYPQTLKANGKVIIESGISAINVQVPYKYINSIHKDMKVIISVEGNNNKIQSTVSSVNSQMQDINNSHFFKIVISTNFARDRHIHLQDKMNVSVSFLLSDKTIWQYIVRK
jgi:hypothetical protein